ncbi:MAG: hypothetical protein ISS70_15515 [Phycisphaerae bacterium]|nr:hypothetical protein [Phycisphaerae bacterium]
MDAPRPRTSHQRKYVGTGDFLTVVAPVAVQARAKAFGATVNGEYVLLSPKPLKVDENGLRFHGTAAYARPNQLALFEGTLLALNGMAIRRDGGEFGISASQQANGTLAGRIVGRSGGTIRLTPPVGFDTSRCQVKVNGAVVPHKLESGAIRFNVHISQSEAPKSYTIIAGQ